MTNDPNMNCPNCGAEPMEEQPQPSLHAFSTVFQCGSQIVTVLSKSQEWEWEWENQCVGKTECDSEECCGGENCGSQPNDKSGIEADPYYGNPMNDEPFTENNNNVSVYISDKLLLVEEEKEEECKIVFAREEFKHVKNSIFLAGPTPRDKVTQSWRTKAIDQLIRLNGFKGTIFIPEDRSGFTDGNFEYDDQINWEEAALKSASTIVFWVPRELEKMPAFTTNIEFGYWIAKDPGKIVFGSPVDAPKMNYLRFYCEKLGIPNFYSMEETLIRASMRST